MVAMEASCFFNLFLQDSIFKLDDAFHPLWGEYLPESLTLVCDFVAIFAHQSNYFVFVPSITHSVKTSGGPATCVC